MRHKLSDDLDKPQGVRAQALRPWDVFLVTVRREAAELPARDRSLAAQVVDNFIWQCGHYSTVVIQIPALRIADTDLAPYGWNRGKHPASIRLEAVSKQIEKAEDDMCNCFQKLAP